MSTQALMRSVAFAMVVALPTFASAASGVVTGRVSYWNVLSDACVPTTSNSNCLGAYYTASQQDVVLPLRNGIVLVVDKVNPNVVWGAGVSDGSGNFTIQWNHGSPNWVLARIVFRPEHSSGAFWVEDAGSIPSLVSNYFFLKPSTSVTTPQSLTPVVWGSSSVPNEYANAYAGAEMAWSNEFSQVNVLLNTMSVRLGLVDPPHGTHAYNGHPGTVHLEPWARFSNGVIAHELGHIAEYRASPSGEFTYAGNYDYGTLSPGWHNWDTPEWGHAQFSEGFADFAEYASVYSVWAPNAMLYGVNLETPDCTVVEAERTERSMASFLWDLYDIPNAPGESDMWRNLYHIYGILGQYGEGRFNHEKNEPWHYLEWTVDDYDGRSGVDYREVAISAGWPASAVMNAYQRNCSVVGD